MSAVDHPLSLGTITAGETPELRELRTGNAQEWRGPRIEVFTADSDFSNSDWVITATNVNPFALPVGGFPWPTLRRCGFSEWDIACNYFNINGTSHDIWWQLMVDGVAVGPELQWNQTGISDALSVMVFAAKLRVIGDTTTQTRYLVTAALEITDSSGNVLVDPVTSAQRFVLAAGDIAVNASEYHNVGWQIRKSSVAGSRVEIQSPNGWRLIGDGPEQ